MTLLRLAVVGLALARGLVFGGCNHTAPRTPGDTVPAADLALVGCDETTGWDDKLGLQPAAPGADELLFIDFRSPGTTKIHARLPLRNSVYGPPTNLVVSRSGRRALVASSIRMTQAAGTWTNSPNSEVRVIDLASNGTHKITIVAVGQQPSGIDISPDEMMALVANRKSRSVSIINLRSNPVLVGEVAVDGEAADAKFTPDGTGAVVNNYDSHSAMFLRIAAGQVTVASRSHPTASGVDGQYGRQNGLGWRRRRGDRD